VHFVNRPALEAPPLTLRTAQVPNVNTAADLAAALTLRTPTQRS
jgi:hypothetical protein